MDNVERRLLNWGDVLLSNGEHHVAFRVEGAPPKRRRKQGYTFDWFLVDGDRLGFAMREPRSLRILLIVELPMPLSIVPMMTATINGGVYMIFADDEIDRPALRIPIPTELLYAYMVQNQEPSYDPRLN